MGMSLSTLWGSGRNGASDYTSTFREKHKLVKALKTENLCKAFLDHELSGSLYERASHTQGPPRRGDTSCELYFKVLGNRLHRGSMFIL